MVRVLMKERQKRLSSFSTKDSGPALCLSISILNGIICCQDRYDDP